MEVCIRKEDVVLLSRKGCGCLVCGKNMQVFGCWYLIFGMVCWLVNDGSQEKWIRASRGWVGFVGRCRSAVMYVPNRDKVIWPKFFKLMSRI